MVTCAYCGQSVDTSVNTVCPYCGGIFPASAFTEQTASGQGAASQRVAQGAGEYSVILVSLGTCTQAACEDLLSNILGYSEREVDELILVLPAVAAQQLARQQALYVSQAMTEYGMEVSVRDGSDYVDLSGEAVESVFDGKGSLTANVLGVLSGISAANRMNRFLRWNQNRYRDHLFRLHGPYNPPPAPPRRRGLFGGAFNNLFGGRGNVVRRTEPHHIPPQPAPYPEQRPQMRPGTAARTGAGQEPPRGAGTFSRPAQQHPAQPPAAPKPQSPRPAVNPAVRNSPSGVQSSRKSSFGGLQQGQRISGNSGMSRSGGSIGKSGGGAGSARIGGSRPGGALGGRSGGRPGGAPGGGHSGGGMGGRPSGGGRPGGGGPGRR